MDYQNPKMKLSSLQALIKKRQSSTFVGREELLEEFKSNLLLSPYDERRKFLFHVWGQGGIGKSFLLKQFESMMQASDGISCYTDEDHKEIPRILSELGKQLDREGDSFKKFNVLYSIYQQKREGIESDPECPSGITSLIGKAVAKGTLDMAEQIPILGTASSLLDKESISNKAGDWATYLMRKIKNKDEVRLLLEPEEVLTPTFIEGVRTLERKYQCIGILFDTFEITRPYVENWLLNLLKGSFGELPINIVFIIAGRSELDKNSWTQYESIISSHELHPFSKEECKEFLRRKNISDENVVSLVMQLSSNLPLLVATLAVGENESWETIGDPSDTAVERFLKWVDESEKKKLALNSSLLRRINGDLIAELLGNENSEDLFVWLKSMPFLQKRSEGWVFHDVVRTQMVRYKRRESLTEFAKIHGLLASYHQKYIADVEIREKTRFTALEIKHAVEYIYHTVSNNPEHEVENSVALFLALLKQNESAALKAAEAILQVGSEQKNQKLIQLGKILCEGLASTKKDSEFDEVSRIRMTEKLLYFHPKDGWLYADKAHTYHIVRRYKQALNNYKEAVNLNYQNHWIFERIGEVLNSLGEFDKAIEALDTAEGKYQSCPSCFLIKADTHKLMGNYNDALVDIDKSISLAPQHHLLYRKKGEILFNQEKYLEALEQLEEAVLLSPNCTTCLFRKAGLNHEAGNLSAALSDYDKILSIRPEDTSSLLSKGVIYQEVGSFSEALEVFNLAIEIEKNNLKKEGKQNKIAEKLQPRLLPEDIFLRKRSRHISNKRARKQSVKNLREFGFFLGSEASRLVIAVHEDPVVRRELQPLLEKHKNSLKARPFIFKAFLCQKLDRFDAALDNVNRAIVVSNSDFFYSCRGRILLRLADYKGAFRDFERSLLFSINEMNEHSELSKTILSNDNVLNHLPEEMGNLYQLAYELIVAKVKCVGFQSARKDVAMIMKKMVNAIHSEDAPFIMYFIGGLYALASMELRAIDILEEAVENEPFLYFLARHDVAWERLWQSPAFKGLKPRSQSKTDYKKGFGL